MRFSAIKSSFRSRIWSLSDPETDSSNVFPLIPHSTCNMRFNPNRSMGDIGSKFKFWSCRWQVCKYQGSRMFEYFDRRGIAIFGGASADLSSQGPMITTSANTIDGILLAENALLRAGGAPSRLPKTAGMGSPLRGTPSFPFLEPWSPSLQTRGAA
jgi:hypothetical protein